MPLPAPLLQRLPPPDAIVNAIVPRLFPAPLRMAALQLAGVRLEEPGTTTVMAGTEVWAARGLEIQARSIVGRHCLLDARGGIRLGRDVNVSSYTRFMTAKHLIDDPGFDAVYEPIVVGDRVWIAIGATILGGVPARKLRERSRDLHYELGYRP
jgi:hypothetical protein